MPYQITIPIFIISHGNILVSAIKKEEFVHKGGKRNGEKFSKNL